jgi:hypothetical protein
MNVHDSTNYKQNPEIIHYLLNGKSRNEIHHMYGILVSNKKEWTSDSFNMNHP